MKSKRIGSFMVSAAMLLMVNSPFISINAYADDGTSGEKSFEVSGELFQFDEKNDYEITGSSPVGAADKSNAVGTLSVSGMMTELTPEGNIPVYEIANSSDPDKPNLITINYSYSDRLLDLADEVWHLESDSEDEINGYELDDKIGNGALLLQISRDGLDWSTADYKTDLIHGSGTVTFSADKGVDGTPGAINDMQLLNNCYYRVVFAYQTEKKTKGKIFSSTECRRYAEVYTFRAGYKSSEETFTGEKHFFEVGPRDENTVKVKDESFGEVVNSDTDDPHYGWSLGHFCLSGFSQSKEDGVYLKNAGKKLRLSFELSENAKNTECLNGNTDLKIASVKNGYDNTYQLKPHNMKHGELIIKKTNKRGISENVVQYADFLAALSSPSADTTIQIFEEGDYEVTLDYAIENDDKWLNNVTYYRASFDFKIRNGNCEVFVFDKTSGGELNDLGYTANGFRIDAAKSSYPILTVNKEVVDASGNSLTEAPHYPRAVSDGETFDEEGIYTVIAVNRYNEIIKAEKKIYVGDDPVLKEYLKNYDKTTGTYKYTLEQLRGGGEDAAPEATAKFGNKYEPDGGNSDAEETAAKSKKPIFIAGGAVAAGLAGLVIFKKKRRRF